jgi:predicted RNase H-like HicB family nuclease
MKYTVIIEKAPNNYAAYAPDVPGCIATGKTVEDVTRNIRDALELHFEVGQERSEPIPEPTTLATVVEVAIPVPA